MGQRSFVRGKRGKYQKSIILRRSKLIWSSYILLKQCSATLLHEDYIFVVQNCFPFTLW